MRYINPLPVVLNIIIRVELQRYIGKPDVFIQFRFLTLIKPSQWWSIPKLTFFLRNENLGTFGILPTAATSSMHWGYPFNIEASLSEWNKECNGAIECNKEYENIATQISETMGEINWCSDVRYKSNPFHDNLILISNTAVDKDSFAFVQRMPTDGNIHRCQILKGNENKFHKIIRKSLQNIPSCMHA